MDEKNIKIVSVITICLGIVGLLWFYNESFNTVKLSLDNAENGYNKPIVENRSNIPVNTIELLTEPLNTSQIQSKADAPRQDIQEMKRLEHTNKPVEVGKPETYQDTVGQCPFNEIVAQKGCVPSSDLICDSAWSDCKKNN